MKRAAAVVIWSCTLLACDADGQAANDGEGAKLSVAALRDPQTCRSCHVQHYAEWESSMHAYAAKDPVFTAMNERGQRETRGALGKFCVQCHAPMATELGLTSDGLGLPDLADPSARGVTCYFCHNADAIRDDHNRGVDLALDDVMRGGTRNPVGNAAHGSTYSRLHDSRVAQSAELCGGCHDIVNDSGAAIERTFAEWRDSPFSDASELKTCAECHMPSYEGRAAPNAPVRTLHRHLWAGVDTALTHDYPGVKAQSAAIECAFQAALKLELAPALPDAERTFEGFAVTLTNAGVGHAWPSGSAQDRRAWVELVAYAADGHVVFQSGVVEEGAVVGIDEPSLEVLRDELYDGNGERVHMFWEAAPSPDHRQGYETFLLGPRGTPSSSRTMRYTLPADAVRVTARVRLQAIGLDVIDDFAGMALPVTERVIADVYMQRGNLRSGIRTITVPGTEREWTLQDGQLTSSEPPPADQSCVEQHYAALL